MVGITPSRSGPLIGRRALAAASTTRSSASSAARARLTTSVPTAVKAMRRPAARSRIGVSSASSSARIPAEKVDCDTAQAFAARPK